MRIFEDKNLLYFNTPTKILSIFDHIRYDRSDLEAISQPQRQYIFDKVKDNGFKWKTGRTLKNEDNIEIIFPKQGILGASPIDILRYEKPSENKIYVLTPTQTACYLLTLNESNFLSNIEKLLNKMPINIKKIQDNIRLEKEYSTFIKHKEMIIKLQEKTLSDESFRGKSHIGRVF